MSKAGDFIKDSTMNISNEVLNLDRNSNKIIYHPWLTPDQALRALEIAREEIVNEVCDYIKDNLYKHLYVCDGEAGFPTAQFINDLKKVIKDE